MAEDEDLGHGYRVEPALDPGPDGGEEGRGADDLVGGDDQWILDAAEAAGRSGEDGEEEQRQRGGLTNILSRVSG